MKDTHDTRTELISTSRRNVLRGAGAVGAFSVFGVPAFSGTAAAATTTQNSTIRSGTGSMVVGYRAGDDSDTFPATEPNVNADLTWVHPNWNPGSDHDFDAETRWIWHCDTTTSSGQILDGEPTYYVKEPVAGDVVEFQDDFSITGTPTSGTLYITADNGYEVYLNGTFVGSAQVFDGDSDWEDSDLGQAYINAQSGSWTSVESYDVSGLLTTGANILTVLGGNEQQSTADGEANGTVTSNPGGVIYEMDVEAEVGVCDDCVLENDVKYEFECVKANDEDECMTWDFVLEGEGDDGITYVPGSFTSKDGEMYEPMTVDFATDYCDLYVLVKSGQEFEVQSFEDVDGTITVETANDEKYAISFVQFFCTEQAAIDAGNAFPSNGKGKGKGA